MNAIISKLGSEFIRRLIVSVILGVIIMVFIPTEFVTNRLIEEKFYDFYPTAIKIVFYSGLIFIVIYVLEWIKWKLYHTIRNVLQTYYDSLPEEEKRKWTK